MRREMFLSQVILPSQDSPFLFVKNVWTQAAKAQNNTLVDIIKVSSPSQRRKMTRPSSSNNGKTENVEISAFLLLFSLARFVF